MNSTIYKIISNIAFSISGIMFLVTLILFVRLNILKIIDELTGRKELREIQKINQQTMAYKTGGLKRKSNGALAYAASGIFQKKIVSEKKDRNVSYVQEEELTAPLFNQYNNKEITTSSFDETERLNETQVLEKTEKLEVWMKVPIKDADASFEIIKDEVLIHTDDTAETEILQD